MSLPSFFVDKSARNDDEIVISGTEQHHLYDVLALRVGEEIEVLFGDGYIHRCKIIDSTKKYTRAVILSSEYVPNDSNITIFMALIKAERMDWAVQKVTECGACRIVPFESEYCVVKDKGNKADRLMRIAISASKQSGRAWLPEISPTITFGQMLDELGNFDKIVVAYEGATQNAKEVLSKINRNERIALVIGSEGGFSEQEIGKLLDKGANVISLGRNILRAETASVALLSALNYELGLWERNK